MSSARFLKILPEVSKAIKAGRPVVALESTILAHGLPYPENRKLAADLSQIIRNRGSGSENVVPATIALQNGSCHVGLCEEDIKNLCKNGKDEALKCSTRDIPFFLAKHSSLEEGLDKLVPQFGATTVASTMRLAHLAGISTFVTGGTGGVHRGAEVDMDVSADLIELSRTPVVVVSAGVKSILDIGLTLEKLETLGVPVATFGSDEFPAFFSPSSGFPSPARIDSAYEVAQAYWASRDLGLPNGILICVPNPDPAGNEIEEAIQEALLESRELGLAGKNVTPFLLKTVAEKTGGASLRSNLKLVQNNALIGAEISLEIAREGQRRNVSLNNLTFRSSTLHKVDNVLKPSSNFKKVVVMGGSVIDIVARSDDVLISGTSNPGFIKESFGGVARNIAEGLGRLGTKPLFYTAVGSDERGRGLIRHLESSCGVELSASSKITDQRTATYLALLDNNGELEKAVADMAVNKHIPYPTKNELNSVSMLVMDANAPLSTLLEAAAEAKTANVPIFFETTSVPKVSAITRSNEFLSYITYSSPNYDELMEMAKLTCDHISVKDQLSQLSSLEDIPIKTAAKIVLSQMNASEAYLLITLGKYGLLLASKYGSDKAISFAYHPSKMISESNGALNVTGAGDTLCSAFIHASLRGCSLTDAIRVAQDAAQLSVKCVDQAIPKNLNEIFKKK